MSGYQKDVFKSTEADQWFIRNRQKSNNSVKGISIFPHVQRIGIKPERILEIGCSSGKYLHELSENLSSKCYGIDPSSQAIEFGKKEFPSLRLQVGSADYLPFVDDSFDMIIFGFCLYLCDRRDLWKIAYEADRCLSEEGVLVILDFLPPFAYKNNYEHHQGVYSYKMDYSKLFLANPSYTQIYQYMGSHENEQGAIRPNDRYGITFLRKSLNQGYPFEPFKNM